MDERIALHCIARCLFVSLRRVENAAKAQRYDDDDCWRKYTKAKEEMFNCVVIVLLISFGVV